MLLLPAPSAGAEPEQPISGGLTGSLKDVILWRRFRGRTGFDQENTPEAACRGWFVGLVKNRTKN